MNKIISAATFKSARLEKLSFLLRVHVVVMLGLREALFQPAPSAVGVREGLAWRGVA